MKECFCEGRKNRFPGEKACCGKKLGSMFCMVWRTILERMLSILSELVKYAVSHSEINRKQ